MGKRLLVIGGDAAGMSAAVQARHRASDLEIVAVEKGRWTSYSACGIPQLAAGAVRSIDELVVRAPDDFRAIRIDVRTGHEVMAVDLEARRAEIHNVAHGRSFYLGFDLLHVATGGRPRRLPVPGLDQPHVHPVQNVEDASDLIDDARRRRPQTVAVVGSDYAGLALAAAFQHRGASVTVVEAAPEILPMLDPDMAGAAAKAVREQGVAVETGVRLTEVTDKALLTDAGEVPAELVILAAGVEANSDLGLAAGLRTGLGGGIVVDRRQRTSAEGVWAAGDCCQTRHMVTGQPAYQPLGPAANKQGRVAGINISGGYASFAGVLGTAAARVCGLEVGRTGLTAAQAEAEGIAAVAVTVDAATAAAYLAEVPPIRVKLIAERGSGRLLGAQVTGRAGSAKRVDVVAAALAGRLTVEDLLGLDLAYAPELSQVWDPLQAAARKLAPDI